MICVRSRWVRHGHLGVSVTHRFGMTLIELMIVVTIIGLLAGVASLRLSGLTGRARFQQATEQLRFIDAGIRSAAVRSANSCQVEFDLERSLIRRTCGNQSRSWADVRLPDQVRITRVRSATRDVATGRMMVHYSLTGTSDSYAVELTGEARGPLWLLFTGLTGKMIQLEDERDVEELLEASSPQGPDAG